MPGEASRRAGAANAAAHWGACLAGQALVETADLEAVGERNRPSWSGCSAGWCAFYYGGDLPAVERAAAGDTWRAWATRASTPTHWYLARRAGLGFVQIPAGPFWMGSDPKKDPNAMDREHPQHEVSLPEYYMGALPGHGGAVPGFR